MRGWSGGGLIPEEGGNLSQWNLDWLKTDKDFDEIRSDPRYDATVKKLKEYALKS